MRKLSSSPCPFRPQLASQEGNPTIESAVGFPAQWDQSTHLALSSFSSFLCCAGPLCKLFWPDVLFYPAPILWASWTRSSGLWLGGGISHGLSLMLSELASPRPEVTGSFWTVGFCYFGMYDSDRWKQPWQGLAHRSSGFLLVLGFSGTHTTQGFCFCFDLKIFLKYLILISVFVPSKAYLLSWPLIVMLVHVYLSKAMSGFSFYNLHFFTFRGRVIARLV